MAIQKVVDNKATYYAKIDVLPEWTRPELTENVPAISIWIDESHALRKYEFQCSAADRYSPLSGFEIVDVRLVSGYVDVRLVRRILSDMANAARRQGLHLALRQDSGVLGY